MADNLDVTAGSGKTVGADEISSVLYQRVKLIYGGDGVNSGDVSTTNPLPVLVSNGTLTVNTCSTVTVSGTVTANAGTNLNTSALALESGGNLAAAVTALQIIDDWDDTDKCKVSDGGGSLTVDGTLTVNTISTVGITGTVTVTTNSTVNVTNTVGVVSLVATDFLATVNTISTVGVNNTVTTTTILRPTKFQGTLNTNDCTTAQTVVNGASTNSNLHITSYLISASASGHYWLEDGSANALTCKHFLAASGGASFTAVDGTPISTTITATTIKIKGTVANTVGCLVLGYSL